MSKSKMPIEFVEVAAPDSLGAALSMSREEWPPQWKPIEESPEWFFMGGYLQTMDFETDPSLYPSHYRLPYADYMTFLKQIRESRGYDITFTAPGSTMHPVPRSSMEDAQYEYYIQLCGYIVEKINDRAEIHGEFYAFHSLVKVVEALRDCLLTFNVKEVQSNELKTVQACIYTETSNRIYIHGWRFKPSNADPPMEENTQDQDEAKAMHKIILQRLQEKVRAHYIEHPPFWSGKMSKSEMPIEFVEVAAPDSLTAELSMSREEWPPQWKPIKESPESFFIGRYLRTKDFEIDPSLYPFHDRLPYADYMMFLKQIRESRGYDITITAPGCNIHPLPLSSMADAQYDYFIQLCGYIVEKINDRAEIHGESYAFYSLVKVVALNEPEDLSDCLLTFIVKEVQSNELKTVQAFVYTETYNRIYIHGWRFKPSNADHPTENRKKNPKKRLKASTSSA